MRRLLFLYFYCSSSSHAPLFVNLYLPNNFRIQNINSFSRDEIDTGMSRLALGDADKQARDWFVATTIDLGCKVTVDTMGAL
jgi:hypothetical protein